MFFIFSVLFLDYFDTELFFSVPIVRPSSRRWAEEGSGETLCVRTMRPLVPKGGQLEPMAATKALCSGRLPRCCRLPSLDLLA